MSLSDIGVVSLYAFLVIVILLAGEFGFRKFDKWKYDRARRIRDDKLRKFGMKPWKNTGTDQWML